MRYATTILAGAVSLVAAGCGGLGGGGGGGDGGPAKPAGDFVAFLADGTSPSEVELFVSDADGTDVRVVSGTLDGNDGNVLEFAWSPDRTRLAFLQDKDGDSHAELYVAALDGSAPTPIFDPGPQLGSTIHDFLWSPTSTQLAVRWKAGFGASMLSVYAADGSGGLTVNGSIVAGGDVEGGYRWRPDGSRIAFRGDLVVDGEVDLFTNLPDGSDRKLINDFGFNANAQVQPGFAWSYDGSRLAFLCDMLVAGEIDLYTNDADGGDQVLESTANAAADVTQLAWSPTSMRIAYTHDDQNDEVFDLYAVLSPDGTPVNLTQYASNGSDDAAELAWAPDGSRVAVLDDFSFHLLTCLPTGGSPAFVDVDVERFEWAPDSTRIAYVRTDVDGAATYHTLAVTAAAGGTVTPISDFVVDGSAVFDFEWSPDSEKIAYVGSEAFANGPELVLADADGTDALPIHDGVFFDSMQIAGFSADSETLCYTSGPANETNVTTVLVDGTDAADLSAPLQPSTDCFEPALK